MVTVSCPVTLGLPSHFIHSGFTRHAPGARGERLDPAAASARVPVLLYQQGLVSDPEVNAKTNEYVLAVSLAGVPVDPVIAEFDRWL